MGLVGLFLAPVYNGNPVIQMSPFTFLKNPILWIQALSKYKVAMTVAPTFGYELVARKVTPADKQGLDLSHLMHCLIGAEPVRATALDKFTTQFAECGFKRSMFRPLLGMAETVVTITSGADGDPLELCVDPASLQFGAAVEVVPEDHPHAKLLVSAGFPGSDTTVRAVDLNSHEALKEGYVGELWVTSTSKAIGYWQRPDLTKEVFHATLVGEEPDAEGYLRTGDIGFVHKGEVFVCGRLKNVVIVNGKNYYPQVLKV